jgi:hypothetical protein
VAVFEAADGDTIVGWQAISGPTTVSITGADLAAAAGEGPVALKAQCRNVAGTVGPLSNSFNVILDTQPPPALASFTGITGSDSDGDVILSWTLPADTSDIANLVIRATQGSTPPADCSSGTVIHSDPAPVALLTKTHASGSSTGEQFSYIACVEDAVGHVTSTNSVAGVQALDTTSPGALVGFSGVSGSTHGEINLSIEFPADTSDYFRVDIYRTLGTTAPDPSCDGTDDSDVAKTFNPPFAAGVQNFVDDPPNGNYGERFSYRACVFDTSTNYAWGSTVVGVRAKDTIFPPALDSTSFTAGGPSGTIDIYLNFPATTPDFNSLTIRRILGATPPNADCATDGTLIYSRNSDQMVDHTYQDTGLTPGGAYSYRICIQDSTGNLTSSQTWTNIQAAP